MSESPSAPPRMIGKRLAGVQELGLILVVAAIYIFFTVASRHMPAPGQWNAFFNLDNQVNGITRKLSVYAIMSVGMTCVIITGGIDISVGAIFAFAMLATGTVLERMPIDAPWYTVMPVAFLVPIVVGGLCGAANGLITAALGIHPFIVTLATLSIYGGMCVLYFPPNVPPQGFHFPHVFSDIMRFDFHHDLEVVPLIVMLVVIALGFVFLQTTVAGRETYAVGGNIEAARFSGIRVWWAVMRVYVIMGICCGIACVVELGRFGLAQTNSGSGYELTVIASAVVGGAALTGGRGTALGALLGTVVITAIENGILTMQWNTNYTKIIVGASILLAVTVDQLSGYFLRFRKRGTLHA